MDNLITVENRAKIWSAKIFNLLGGLDKDEKNLFFRGRTEGVYRGFATMLDDDYPCYMKFSRPVSSMQSGWMVGLVILKSEAGRPEVRFGAEFSTDREFLELPPHVIYDYTKGYARRSYLSMVWAFAKRFRFRQLIRFIRNRRRDNKKDKDPIRLYSDKYEDEERGGAECEYVLTENTRGYMLKKNQEIIGIVDRLVEVSDGEKEKIEKWNFRPTEGMPPLYNIMGKIRTYISRYMWLFNGRHKYF